MTDSGPRDPFKTTFLGCHDRALLHLQVLDLWMWPSGGPGPYQDGLPLSSRCDWKPHAILECSVQQFGSWLVLSRSWKKFRDVAQSLWPTIWFIRAKSLRTADLTNSWRTSLLVATPPWCLCTSSRFYGNWPLNTSWQWRKSRSSSSAWWISQEANCWPQWKKGGWTRLALGLNHQGSRCDLQPKSKAFSHFQAMTLTFTGQILGSQWSLRGSAEATHQRSH